MNNPYRARPGRLRDHTASTASKYGVQNQNWPSIAPNNQPANVYPSQPVANQVNQAGDPWDWDSENVDNGNDSWNWSIDQSNEQSHQQQQFVPTYPNLRHQNCVQDNYYSNINGNRPISQTPHQLSSPNTQTPHQLSGPNTPRTIPSRESTPSQPDSYNQYTNYNLNQPPPRTNSTKSSSSADNQNIQPFNTYFPPTSSSFDVTNHPPQSQQLSPQSNYNWNGVEQSVTPQSSQPVTQNSQPVAQNWQNQDATPYWQDQNLRKEVAPDNQWSQQAQPYQQHQQQQQQKQQQQYHHQPPTSQAPNVPQNRQSNQIYKEPQNWHENKVDVNQLRRPSQEINLANQWHDDSHNTRITDPANQATYLQTDNSNINQSWQNVPFQNALQEKSPEVQNKLTDISLNSSPEEKVQQDWQSEETSMSYASSENKQVNPINKEEAREEHSRFSVPESHDNKSAFPDVEGNLLRPQSSDKLSFENMDAKENETSWSAERGNLINDLTTSVNQLSLANKPYQGFENPMPFSTHSGQVDSRSPQVAHSMNKSQENLTSLPPNQHRQLQVHSLDHSTSLPHEPVLSRLHLQERKNLAHPIHKSQENIISVSLNQRQHQVHSQDHPTALPYEPRSHLQEHNAQAIQPQSLHHQEHAQVQPQPPHHHEHNIAQVVQQLHHQERPMIYAPSVPSEFASPMMHKNVQPLHSGALENSAGYHKTSNESIHTESANQEPKKLETQAPEMVSPTSYDTWYNQKTRNENNWYPNETVSWSQPLDKVKTPEFINVDTPSVERSEQIPPQESVLEETPKEAYQIQPLQEPDSYEFASNDRNTFLETGELTDSHHDQEISIPQEEDTDEVPSDIPFIREVPGQSSSIDPRRNPTGQEQYLPLQSTPRLADRRMSEHLERRDVPPGQERRDSSLSLRDADTLERRNDPSGREQSLPPSQSRNDPSGEERTQNESQTEPVEVREVPGSRITVELPSTDGIRQITVGAPEPVADDRVVPGSQEMIPGKQDSIERNKREEAVGASMRENPALISNSPKRRDSFEDGDDEESANSRDDNRERRRDQSPSEKRRYDYDRKGDRGDRYYDRDRKYEEDYYYDRRRGPDFDRSYNSREDLDRRESSFREGERRHASRDDLDDRRRLKDEDEREGRRRDERRGHWDDSRRRDGRDYDARERERYPRDSREREHDRRRDGRRRWYDDYDPRDPRRDYYEDYTKSSRPSSRSSYNDRERDYWRGRDPYYGYNDPYGAYDYGSNYNANYYAYLENLRRTNPTAYMEWYNKYYANQQQQHPVARGVANYPEDRASVHSGRSSCEDRGTSGKQTIGDISLLDDARAISRLTPTKFSTSHVKGSLSIGSLVQVHASYPADGERARVDIIRLDSLLMHDPIARELRVYPGPLIKGVTHKKTIIEYCEMKIKKAPMNDELIDHASYILLYQLMVMLIQQNGNVVGVDIATLLLRNKETYPYEQKDRNPARRESMISQRSGGAGSVHEDVTQEVEEKQQKTVEQVTNEFRNTLLYGLVQEALEYAMNECLWGHALFLASKLDKRTHASVMTRFANSLPAQDSLQTLYQLHSGRVPASVTCVADPKWDDWRPHLAMIISNTSANPEINRRAITTLGDTLAARGDIHAAHFCYILAQIEFGIYGSSGVKLILIGANHHKPYSEFVTPEAVMLTEIYEYARNLSESGFTLIGLQTFKLETAQKMVDYGLIEKALLYLEQIAVNIVQEPSKYKQSFINDVYTLSERIKYHDPVFKDCVEDETTLAWLYNLREIGDRCQAGEIVPESSNVRTDSQNVPETDQQEQRDVQQQSQQWGYTGNQEYGSAPSLMEVPSDAQDQWQPMSHQPTIQDSFPTDQNAQYTNIDGNQYHQQPQDYWGQQMYNQQDYGRDYASGDWQQQSNQMYHHQDQNDVDSAQPGGWNYESEKEEKPSTPEPQPQISMGSSAGKQYDPLEELDALESPSEGSKTADSKKYAEKAPEKKTAASGGSWFGGLFSKLTQKPKNQMILPDDNNPTIVWDSVAKKWMNKDENGDSASLRLVPPPKMSEMNIIPTPTITTAPPAPTEQIPSVPTIQEPARPSSAESTTPNTSKMISGSNNMFKLQKGRSMRANYIDVMNPGGMKTNGPPSTVPTPAASPLMQPIAASSPQLFVPAPVNDPNAPVDFLTPTPTIIPSTENTSQGLSRWSSASSLSREVQSYTMRDPRLHQRIKGPMMYNPAEVKENSMKNMPRRYAPR